MSNKSRNRTAALLLSTKLANALTTKMRGFLPGPDESLGELYAYCNNLRNNHSRLSIVIPL